MIKRTTTVTSTDSFNNATDFVNSYLVFVGSNMDIVNIFYSRLVSSGVLSETPILTLVSPTELKIEMLFDTQEMLDTFNNSAEIVEFETNKSLFVGYQFEIVVETI